MKKINRQSIQRTVLLTSLLCALSLSLKQVSAAHPQEPSLDRRITESSSFTRLTGLEPWEQTTSKRTDRQDQWRGCATGMSHTPGSWNAYRASNLAASKHYDEAITELTKAISCYDTPQRYELPSQWLVRRAKLYKLVGRKQEAAADIKRTLTLKRCSDSEKFLCAKLLIECGEYADAESILQTLIKSSPYFHNSCHYYLLGIAQEKQGKKGTALVSYRNAATLFASSGLSAPTQACLDAVSIMSGKPSGKGPLSLRDLTPPRSNADKIENLIKALMTQDDVFDRNKLKALIGTSEIKEVNTGNLTSGYTGHLKELQLVAIDKLPTGGQRLRIYLTTPLCSIDRSAFASLAKTKIDLDQKFKTDTGHSEGFKVPSGTIIFSLLDQGFKPIQQIELYSKDATYPPPTSSPTLTKDTSASASVSPTHPQPNSPQATGKTRENYYQLLEFYGDSANWSQKKEKLVEQWLKEEPESPRPHMQQADIFASHGQYEEAIKSIETAQKFQENDESLQECYYGDTLRIKRGSYLLELGKFKEALAEFRKGFPEQPTPDQLLMRGRAELGLKKYPQATRDLQAACEDFYNSCRIVKRDEAKKLLESIPAALANGAPTLKSAPAVEQQHQENKDSIEAQRRQAETLIEAAKEQALKEEQAAMANALNKLAEAKQEQGTKPDRYILALLEMASSSRRRQKTDEGKQYLDQAITYYATYTFRPGDGPCTRYLLFELQTLKGEELATRLDKFITASELSCKNERFREERDYALTQLASNNQDEEINILSKMIEVRERMQSRTGISASSLYLQISYAYSHKGYENLAVEALKKAIAKSPDRQTRSYYRRELVSLFQRHKKLDLAKREWRKAAADTNGQESIYSARGLVSIADAFWRQGDRTTCKEVLWQSLTNVDRFALKEIDDLLSDLIKDFEKTKEYPQAEALLRRRVEAGRASRQDDSLSDWQMQLSELYLRTGHPEQSENIYQQTRKSAIERGDATRGIDLRRRQTLERAGIKPKAEKSLTAEAQAKSITFPHVLYAFSELSLNDNTATGSCNTSLRGRKPSTSSPKDENGDVSSLNKLSIAGNTMVYGSIYGKLPQDTPQQIAIWTRLGKTQNIPQAIVQPNSLIIKGSSKRTKLGDYKGGKILAGGDYEATSISALHLPRKLTKPVRIFITDDSIAERYAVKLGSSNVAPENLQIWYLGCRPMIFEHNSDVSAVIYAPYSCLTMGNNNCSFRGAIVADKITTIGNVSAIYDKALKNKVFIPSEPAVAPAESEEEPELLEEKEDQEEVTHANSKTLQEARDKRLALFQSRLNKYPALLKLDLLNGPVIYQEIEDYNPGTSCGMIEDGKGIDINGASSIKIVGENDGTSTIILNGLRLMDQALLPLKKKDYRRAEEILVAALRSKPESEAFTMLAQCWYQQGRFNDALQACQMALEIDPSDRSAQLLKEQLIPKVKQNGHR